MASSLLVLLDDIATLLDDVAVLSKAAAGKTAGVLGDDLALNAYQLAGLRPQRELPVVLAVARGSLLNKAVLVPAALLIATFVPALVIPLLMLGGLYLCFEGTEKLFHRWLADPASESEHALRRLQALADPGVDLLALERERIRGAVRTDFILSAEIIVITLGTVAEADFALQLLTLVAIALLMTLGVYGLVAAIVKLDDVGLYLAGRQALPFRALGRLMLALAPRLMKALSVAGTAAMFLVGGGILVHGLGALDAWLADLSAVLGGLAWLGHALGAAMTGLVGGALALAVRVGAGKLFGRRTRKAS
ncbi:MAG: membrane protein [Lysobacteraceae bacterium]|nr:MAG: membrane protein [Xanthomonadaceae bacterium]